MRQKCWLWLATLVAAVALGLAAPRSALAQSATIRGAVTDSATQRALEGAEVSVVGTNSRTVTRGNGQYVLNGVTPGTLTLRVRMIGHTSADRNVTVGPNQDVTMNFSLPASLIQLEDVVVVGYGTQDRTLLTTSTTSVGSDEIQGQPIASVDAALQGKAPGVQVTQNAGNPGNGITVRIRGSASVSASNQPLYVIDGVPMISEAINQLGMGGQSITPVSGLEAGDIESFDVLKDAAAAAIYGSRGSNGVVMITTRRGASGAPHVTMNSYIGTQSVPHRLNLMNSQQYLAFMNEASENDGYGADYFGVPGVDDRVNTNWQDAVLQSAPIGATDLAFQGGTPSLRYRLSGSYLNQQGTVIGSAYQRLGGRANLDFGSVDKLAFSTSLAVSGEDNSRIENDASGLGIITNAVGNAPLYPVRHDGGFTGVGGSFPDGLQYPNSVALGTLNNAKARTVNIIGNAELHWMMIPGLQFNSRVGLDLHTVRESEFESRQVSGTYAASADGVAISAYSTANRYVFDNFLTLSRTMGTRHSISLTGGNSIELNRGELNYIQGEGLSNEQLTQVRNASVITGFDATNTESNLISFFSRATYALDGKYLAGASLRTDGSSKFGPNNRWGVFPAVSAGWILSQESFLKGNHTFDFLKLRASYGLTGNQPSSDFPFQSTFGSANYGSTPGLAPQNLGNPDLSWESTKQLDLGVDADLFSGRVNVTADYYNKKTSDLLINRPVTCTSGFCSVFSNVGNMQNKGIELGINAIVIDSRGGSGLRWTTAFNISHNHNEITALFNNEAFTAGIRQINRVEVGQPIGAFYALKFLGVDPATGDAIYKDANGDGSITPDDRVIVGSPHPDFTGGFRNTFALGNFDLTGFMQFSHGNKVFNAMRVYSGNGGYNYDNQFADQLDRWQQPGDKTDTPRASYDGTAGGELTSSRFIENGSYLRLQEVTLGFNVPLRVAGMLGFSQARVYVSGFNLFTITDYTGYDPELNSNGSGASISLGSDFYAYPLARTFTFGIQAGW